MKANSDKKEIIQYEFILENLPVYVLLINKNLDIIYVNRVAEYVDIRSVLGKNVAEFYDAKEFVKIKKTALQVFKRNKAQALETKVSDKWINNRFYLYLIPYRIENKDSDLLIAVNVDNQMLFDTRVSAEISEFKFKKIVENLPDSIIQIDSNYKLLYINRLKHVPEHLQHNIYEKSIFEYIPDKKYVEILKRNLKKSTQTRKTQFYEIEAKGVGGMSWFRGNCTPIFRENEISGYIIHYSDITEQKLEQVKTRDFNLRLEELIAERTLELQQMNEENTVLLQEMHHRVKNNLQIINSLLSLQRNFANEESQQILKLCQNRIQSMALVHEMLYNNKQLSAVNIQEYIITLARNTIFSYPDAPNVDYLVDVKLPDTLVEMGNMITIGLLINELLSNSMKHAFKTAKFPKISILLHASNLQKFNTELIYADNGSGIKEEKSQEGMGSLLIESFVSQLNGEFELKNHEKGLEYRFHFSI